MVSWYWLILAFMLGGSLGFLTIGLAVGARQGGYLGYYSDAVSLKSIPQRREQARL